LVAPFENDFPNGTIGSFLQYSIKYVNSVELEKWIKLVLSSPGVTVAEQAFTLTASLAYSGDRFEELLTLVAGNPECAAVCCVDAHPKLTM
jgi:hypothetical protein